MLSPQGVALLKFGPVDASGSEKELDASYPVPSILLEREDAT